MLVLLINVIRFWDVKTPPLIVMMVMLVQLKPVILKSAVLSLLFVAVIIMLVRRIVVIPKRVVLISQFLVMIMTLVVMTPVILLPDVFMFGKTVMITMPVPPILAMLLLAA